MPVVQAPNGTLQVLEDPGEKASNLLSIGSVEKIVRGKLFQGVNVEKIFQRLGMDRAGNIGLEGFGKGLERLNVFLDGPKLRRLFQKYSNGGTDTLNVKQFLAIVEGASTRDGAVKRGGRDSFPSNRSGRAHASTSTGTNSEGGFYAKFTSSPPRPRGRNHGPTRYERDHSQPQLPRMGLAKAVKVATNKLQLCRDLRATVRQFDVNHDGHLQKGEFNSVLEASGLFLHPDDLRAVFEKFDPEGDGITYQDFKRILAHSEMTGTDQWTRWAKGEFNRLDTDRDGFLSMAQCFELLSQVQPIKVKSLEEIADSFPGRDLVPMADLIAFVDERIQSKVRRSWHKAGGFRLGSEKDPLQPPRPTVESKQSRGRRHVQHESKMRSTMEGKQVDKTEFVPGMYRPQVIDGSSSLPAGGKKLIHRGDTVAWQERHLREVLATKLSKNSRLVENCISLDSDQDGALSRNELKKAVKSVDMKVDEGMLDTILRHCAAHGTAAAKRIESMPTGLGSIGLTQQSSGHTAGGPVSSHVNLEQFLWSYGASRYGDGLSKCRSSTAPLPVFGARRVRALLRRRLARQSAAEAIIRSMWALSVKTLRTAIATGSSTDGGGHTNVATPASAEAAKQLDSIIHSSLADNGIVFSRDDHAKFIQVLHARYARLPAMSFLKADVPPPLVVFLEGVGVSQEKFQSLLDQLKRQQQQATRKELTAANPEISSLTNNLSHKPQFLGLRRVHQRIQAALFPSSHAPMHDKEGETKSGGVSITANEESTTLRQLRAAVLRIENHDNSTLDDGVLRYLLSVLKITLCDDDISLLLNFHNGTATSSNQGRKVQKFLDFYVDREDRRAREEQKLRQKKVYDHRRGLPKLGLHAMDKAIAQKLSTSAARQDFVSSWKKAVLEHNDSTRSPHASGFANSPSAAAATATLFHKKPLGLKAFGRVLWDSNLRFCDADLQKMYAFVTGKRDSSRSSTPVSARSSQSAQSARGRNNSGRRESLVSRNSTTHRNKLRVTGYAGSSGGSSGGGKMTLQVFLRRFNIDAASLARPSQSPDAAARARRRSAVAKRSNEVVLGPKRVEQKLRRAVTASLNSDMRIATMLALTDIDGKGIVTRDQLRAALREFRVALSEKDFSTLWEKTLGRGNSDILNYDRFLRKFGATRTQQAKWQEQRWKLHGIRRQKHHAKFATVGLGRTKEALGHLLASEEGRRAFVTACAKEDRRRDGSLTVDQLDRALRRIPSLQVSHVDLKFLVESIGSGDGHIDYMAAVHALLPHSAMPGDQNSALHGGGGVGMGVPGLSLNGAGKRRFDHQRTHDVDDPLVRLPTERRWREMDEQMQRIQQEQQSGAEEEIGLERAADMLRHKLFTHYTKVVRVFRRHDSANSGLVTPEELHQIFTECKVFISRRDLDSVLEAYDDFQTHPDSHGHRCVRWKSFIDTVSGLDGKINEMRHTKLSAHKDPPKRAFDLHEAHKERMEQRDARNREHAKEHAPSRDVTKITALLREKLRQQPRKFERVMRHHDKDRDGRLNLKELQAAMRDLDLVARRVDVVSMMSAHGDGRTVDWKQLSIELSNHFMIQGRMV